MTGRTTHNSFAKAGFIVNKRNLNEEDWNVDDVFVEEIKIYIYMRIQLKENDEINDNIQIDNFISIDSVVVSLKVPTEPAILFSVLNKTNAMD